MRWILIATFLISSVLADAQICTGDSWQTVRTRGYGTVTALWDEIEPFIYTGKDNRLLGVEFEIMESFQAYIKKHYNADLRVEWKKAGSFDSIYYKVKNGRGCGLFGWSYYSITPERMKEVDFSLPYMPDVNVLVTNNREPMYATAQEFTARLREMTAYTQPNTTMAEDVTLLKNNFHKELPVVNVAIDYDVLKEIEANERSFGYVPLSIYIVALQKGIKVKRQMVLATNRQGFAAVMPKGSDWKPLIDEYFSSPDFRQKAGNTVAKYLGSRVKDLVFDTMHAGHDGEEEGKLDLVSLEKEIVTRRLMDTAVEAQQHRSYRNIMLIILVSVALLAAVLYSRFRTKQKLNRQLRTHNEEIIRQRDQINEMNKMLQLKILQSRLNPHFLFNSLNSIQYFVMGDDKSATLTYMNRFSSFLRKIIEYGDSLSVDAEKEAGLLEEYLWLEQYRFKDRFRYAIRLDKNSRDSAVLPLISLSLVEDALYKGMLNLPEGETGQLDISFERSNGTLKVSVTDNGLPRSSAKALDQRKGLVNGTGNILERRLQLFNKQSKKKIYQRLRELSDPQATIAELEIPQPLFESDQTITNNT
ncbi:histidine kinase [Terrimonas ferruginea]|uniref:histidine kinase n=1 Tax=Terrimonas ferruginea TaxID=249 RepID=UPI000414D515|nr:histidine kinase [Terrimonas ferruginea]